MENTLSKQVSDGSGGVHYVHYSGTLKATLNMDGTQSKDSLWLNKSALQILTTQAGSELEHAVSKINKDCGDEILEIQRKAAEQVAHLTHSFYEARYEIYEEGGNAKINWTTALSIFRSLGHAFGRASYVRMKTYAEDFKHTPIALLNNWFKQ